MSEPTNEDLETAVRGYVGHVLEEQGSIREGQDSIMVVLADIRAQQAVILTKITELAESMRVRLAERDAGHAAELSEIAVGQAETLAAAEAAAAEVAAGRPGAGAAS